MTTHAARLLGTLLLLSLGAGRGAGADEGQPASAPRLEASELVYDAGKVNSGATVSHTFVLKNVGTGDLSVDAKPG